MKIKHILLEGATPKTVYHGGPEENLLQLLKNFEILSDEEKMSFSSTGGGEFGLSTSVDKHKAMKYSKAHGYDKVLAIKVASGVKIKYIDDEIPNLNYYELEELSNEGYDAVMETVTTAESELRIFNPAKFKPIQLLK